jgi:hypothetical protein
MKTKGSMGSTPGGPYIKCMNKTKFKMQWRNLQKRHKSLLWYGYTYIFKFPQCPWFFQDRVGLKFQVVCNGIILLKTRNGNVIIFWLKHHFDPVKISLEYIYHSPDIDLSMSIAYRWVLNMFTSLESQYILEIFSLDQNDALIKIWLHFHFWFLIRLFHYILGVAYVFHVKKNQIIFWTWTFFFYFFLYQILSTFFIESCKAYLFIFVPTT